MITQNKFSTISELGSKYSVSKLCALAKVSRSGFYKWKNRLKHLTNREKENYEIERNLKALHTEYKGIYGRLRLCACLNKLLTFRVNHKRVYRLMKKLDIKSVIRKKRYSRKYIEGKKAKNILNREFTSNAPLEKLCMDTTYIPIQEGRFLFLNAVKDLYNNEIVAYDISARNDIKIVDNTLKKLYKLPIPKGCILHTDQGFQFTREAYNSELKANNIEQSMSRKGNCWDNAPIESFFSHMKSEAPALKKRKLSEDEAKDIVVDYIKFYNNKRIQLKLKGLSPVKYKAQAA